MIKLIKKKEIKKLGTAIGLMNTQDALTFMEGRVIGDPE